MTKLMAQPPAGFIPPPDAEPNARFWDWEKDGDTIQGDYHGTREIQTKNGPSIIHDIVTDTEAVAVWGKAVLDKQLKAVVPGQEVWIHRLGKEKGQNGTEYWNFEIFVKPLPEPAA